MGNNSSIKQLQQVRQARVASEPLQGPWTVLVLLLQEAEGEVLISEG